MSLLTNPPKWLLRTVIAAWLVATVATASSLAYLMVLLIRALVKHAGS